MRLPADARRSSATSHFNPRTPRGVRHFVSINMGHSRLFQSTHPARGATRRMMIVSARDQAFQSTHPARGATASRAWRFLVATVFQSTHPARGATRCAPSCAALWTNFNPRTPRGVRLSQAVTFTGGNLISIHAPREGCDAAQGLPFNGDRQDFNPRTPRGVRPVQSGSVGRSYEFQSTHPARGATTIIKSLSAPNLFQSTHPARGATASHAQAQSHWFISIHAPREGCDSR